MRVRGIGCSPLSAVTNRTAISRRIVNHIGVPPIKAVAFDAVFTRSHSDMTAHASVRCSDLPAHYLSQLNRKRFGLRRGKPRPNFPLDPAPIAQEVLMDRGPQQHRQCSETRPKKQMFVGFHGSNSRMSLERIERLERHRTEWFKTFTSFQ